MLSIARLDRKRKKKEKRNSFFMIYALRGMHVIHVNRFYFRFQLFRIYKLLPLPPPPLSLSLSLSLAARLIADHQLEREGKKKRETNAEKKERYFRCHFVSRYFIVSLIYLLEDTAKYHPCRIEIHTSLLFSFPFLCNSHKREGTSLCDIFNGGGQRGN